MSIQIGNYAFRGPVGAPECLGENFGVYAVLTRRFSAERYAVIDVGEPEGIQKAKIGDAFADVMFNSETKLGDTDAIEEELAGLRVKMRTHLKELGLDA